MSVPLVNTDLDLRFEDIRPPAAFGDREGAARQERGWLVTLRVRAGRVNEHTDPHLVGSWDDAPASLEPPVAAEGRRDVRWLAGIAGGSAGRGGAPSEAGLVDPVGRRSPHRQPRFSSRDLHHLPTESITQSHWLTGVSQGRVRQMSECA